ncbi:MAG TPA: His/Gly/Thr/Pro-type tRNA ligase C-terminal domain-containing protein, partial [Acidocella sp.]|nr:His/Gly/Thr/Pro-type tRNA ligase C-terminal domain-containing protein [Acidocella sp.]
VTNALGAQGTVMAGGRYDGLVEQMGGPNVPGVGWGAGIERLSMLIAAPPAAAVPVAVIPMGADCEDKAVRILNDLRQAGIAAETAYSGNVKKRMERANKSGAAFAVLVGEDVKLKNLASGEQADIAADDLARYLRG